MRTTVHAAAPGRVNLIGEHTDYNGGFVLPMAIPQQTRVELTSRDDRLVRAHSDKATPDAEYELGHERRADAWFDYIQGVTWALQQHAFELGGFDVEISSDVPLGGGVSSSASLEVALLRALRQGFQLELDDVRLARLGQFAENDFVGARCGIMDQMSASLADAQTALFLDTRSLELLRSRRRTARRAATARPHISRPRTGDAATRAPGSTGPPRDHRGRTRPGGGRRARGW
jgi:galactokinase